MSEHWTAFCEDCEVYGPDIHRAVGRGVQLGALWPRYHGLETIRANEPYSVDVQGRWQEFLEEHGWHTIKLVHE